jgi:hypothetical protein
LEAAGVASRCEVRGGDAFTAVPAGYETYLLSRVIHDWDDERSIALLTRSKQAMQPRGKVLLVERLILTGTTPTLLVLESDVQMLVVATSRLGSHKFGVSYLSDPSVTIGIGLAFHLRNASYLLKASPRNVIKASSRVGPLV